MPTIATIPPIPLPNRPCKVTVTPDATPHPGSAIRVWCTDAPIGSELRTKLDKSGSSRVAIATVDAGKFFELTPEKAGGYVLRLEELRRGSGFTGDYAGDPRGAPAETILKTSSVTLQVATEISSQLGVGNDRATLVLHTHNGAILNLLENSHGVRSPRIDLPKPPTARAKIAAENAEVRETLRLFTNDVGNNFPPSRVLGDQPAIIDSLIKNLNFHLRGSRNHAESASDQQIPADFLHPATPASIVATLSKIRTTLDRHVRNDDGSGTGTADWHEGEDGDRVDWAAVPLVTPTEQTTDACLADLCRCTALHFQNEGVHLEPGGTIIDLFQESLLVHLHQLFIRQIAALNPTAPATSDALAAQFIARGFKEA